jgi:hypothetical protein
MRRLLLLLLMLTLSVTNGAAVAAAVCEHRDARAHQAALASSDLEIAADAHHEEAAAAAAEKKAGLADAAAVQLAGFLQPAEPAFAVPAAVAMTLRPGDAARLSHRTTRPLLTPPLG